MRLLRVLPVLLSAVFAACEGTPPPDAPHAHTEAALFTNSGFESGNLTGWTVTTGLVATSPGVTAYPVNSEAQLGLRSGGTNKTSAVNASAGPFTLIPPGLTATETARYPRYGNWAAVVNELGSSYNANKVTQSSVVTTADIDPADGLVHVRFVVLPVLQNPGHSLREQPYYYVAINNVTKGTTLASRFNFSNEAGVPWQSNSNGSVVYTDWLLFDLPLARDAVSIGDTLSATVIAGGCAQSGHWGEAIIDSFGAFIPGLVAYGAGPDSVEAGSDFQYSYRVLNGSASTSTGTKLTAYLPAGTTFRSVDTAGVSCTTPTVGTRGTVSCTLGALAAGASTTVKVTVRADATATGEIRHGWYFSESNQEKPLTGPLVTTKVTTGGTTQYVDLVTSVDDATGSLAWGQQNTWAITVLNRGPSTATGARVVGNAPAQLTGLSWTCTAQAGASCGAASGSGALDATATIPAGKSVTWSLTANVVPGVGTGLVSVTARATAPAGTVEQYALDNGAGDDDTLSTLVLPVTVQRAGAGGGALIATPSGLSCGAGCTGTNGTFAVGTPVTLQAVPAAGSYFVGWSGGTCTGTGACTFTVTAAQNVIGTFERIPTLITSAATAMAAVGRPFSYAVTATGTAPITFNVSGLPAWASFDASTGLITGTPPSTGTATVSLSASDVNGTANQALTITIGVAPTITSALTFSVASAGTAWSAVTVTASGTATIQYNASNLPGTVYFNSTTGAFAGSAGAVGVYNVPVVATNAYGADYRVVAVSVGGAPIITSALTASASVGAAFSYTLTATPSGVTRSVSSLPAWASFDAATGVISGTPTAAGTLSIGLTASNGVGTSNQALVLTVAGPAIITSALTANGTGGQAFAYTLTAEGTQPITRSVSGLPAWLAFDAASGLLSGTPPAPGSFTIDLAASNAVGGDSKTLTLTIAAPPPTPTPPNINSALTASGTVGAPFVYTLTAGGAVPMTFAASGLPAWATFDAATGTITGTPSQAGSATVQLTATNALGEDNKSLVISIVAPPVITSALTATAIVGEGFGYTATATGTGVITFGATGVPAWATFAGGVLSGTPTAEGDFTVQLRAENDGGADTKSLLLSVRTRPAITSGLSAEGVVGQALSYTLTASGSTPRTLTVGTLPSWASFDAQTGVLSGTPDAEGTFTVGLGVSNAAGTASASLQLVVRTRAQVTSASSADAVVGQAFSYTLTASGTAPLSYSTGALPAWLSFSAASGLLSGTPTADGATQVFLTADNAAGSDTRTLTITTRTRPHLTSAATATAIVGEAFSFTVTTSGTAPRTLQVSGLPAWASFDAQTGLLSGTPDADVDATLGLTVTNAAGSDSQTLQLTVLRKPAVTSALAATAIVGDAFSYALTASGTAPRTLNVSGLPAWASFDAQTGVISGTPDADVDASIALSVTNAAGTDTRALQLTVRARPAITSALTEVAIVGDAFTYTLTASGTAPRTLNVSGLPAWASFDAQTGVISGTPDADVDASIALSVTNVAGTDTRTLLLTVRARPAITSTTQVDAVVGQAFTFVVTTTGTAPRTVIASGLPAWASFDAQAGLVTGTPDADFDGVVTFTVTNAAGTVSKGLHLTVRSRPAITSAVAVDAIVGLPFSYTFTATGTAALTLETGALPAWLSFDAATGVLSGVPAGDALEAVVLQVSNAAGSAQQTLLITVRTRPAITSATQLLGMEGAALSLAVTATGTGPISLSATGLPPGVSLVGGVITGAPTTAGHYEVLVTATNAAGSTTVTVVIDVRAALQPPTIVAPAAGAQLGTSTVVIVGTAGMVDAGHTVKVMDGATHVCDALVDVDGTWSCMAMLTEGAHALTATVIDGHGFEGPAANTGTFTVDLTAPASVVVTAPQPGVLATVRPAFSGTGEVGARVTVSRDGMTVCTAIVAADGTWACTATAAQPEGERTFSITQRDAAGNASEATTVRLALDVTAPTAPAMTSPIAGSVLGSGEVIFTGTAEAGSTVRVTVDGVERCTTTADAQGRFSCTAQLTDGAHAVTVTATDAAGNVASASAMSMNVDTQAPAAPALTSPIGGASTGKPTYEGTGEPGATVRVVIDGQTACTTTVAADGTWRCEVSQQLSDGAHTVSITITDAAGHTSQSVDGTITVSGTTGTVTPPGGTVGTGDNGHLEGTATPGATVNIYVDGQLVGTTTADAHGRWAFELPLLSAGAHTVAIGVVGVDGREVRTDEAVLTVEATGFRVGGGGLGCSSSGGSPMWVLAALFLGALWRRGARKVARATTAVAVAAATTASAQAVEVSGFDLEQLQLNPGARSALVVGGGDVLLPMDFRVAASLGYQHAPLVFFQDGERKAALVENRLTTTLSGALGVLPWLEVGASVPLVVFQNGQAATSSQGDLVSSAVPQQVSFGTPWLQTRVAPLQERNGAPIDLGVTLAVGIPLGGSGSLTSEPFVTGQALVGAARTVGPVRLAVDLGGHFRAERNITATDVVGSRLLGGLGVSTVSGPLRGEVSVRGFVPLVGQPASGELLGGARYALGDFELFALAGPGLGNAPGTPLFRAVLGVSFGGVKSGRCTTRGADPASCPSLDFDGDGVANGADACPTIAGRCGEALAAAPTSTPTQPQEPVAVAAAPEVDVAPAAAPQVELTRERIELHGVVQFETNRAVVGAVSYPLLDEVAALLTAHPEVSHVRVEGHTDDRGDAAANLRLSKARAAAVREYLVKQGVASERLRSEGYGHTQPITSNETAAGREQNRRVVFTIDE